MEVLRTWWLKDGWHVGVEYVLDRLLKSKTKQLRTNGRTENEWQNGSKDKDGRSRDIRRTTTEAHKKTK